MHDVFLNMVFMFLRTVSQTDERKKIVVAVEMKRFLFAFWSSTLCLFSSLNNYLLNKVGGV